MRSRFSPVPFVIIINWGGPLLKRGCHTHRPAFLLFVKTSPAFRAELCWSCGCLPGANPEWILRCRNCQGFWHLLLMEMCQRRWGNGLISKGPLRKGPPFHPPFQNRSRLGRATKVRLCLSVCSFFCLGINVLFFFFRLGIWSCRSRTNIIWTPTTVHRHWGRR